VENNVVDARGLACPEPVVNTKRALDSLASGEIITIVDNEIARDNILRFAESQCLQAKVEQKENDFYIRLTKGGVVVGMHPELATAGHQVLLITANTLGRGSEELGRVLMQSLFYTLVEREGAFRHIILMNSGVQLACEGSPVLNHLWQLERRGVEILACGTCLDYYGLKAKLSAGKVSNMYAIMEHLAGAVKVLSL